MTKCPYCGKDVVLKSATFIYPNHKKAKYWGKVWVCSDYPNCDAYVGCHKGTDIPKGRLANEKLRFYKKEAHKQFDPIWKSGLMSRREAYKWLASMMNLSLDDCHIGMFDISDCQKVIDICKRQDNTVINDYKRDHRTPVFTRGYEKSLSHHHRSH